MPQKISLTAGSADSLQTGAQKINSLIDELMNLDPARADIVREAIHSGVVKMVAITAGQTSTPNAFILAKEDAFINGFKHIIQNFGGKTDGTNLLTLNAPPASNVTPSLSGSARDDLVFLEAWFPTDWQLGQSMSMRLRMVNGVDFASYPEGLTSSNATITAQGGASAPVTGQSAWLNLFYSAKDRNGSSVTGKKISAEDAGLYIAGDGTASSQAALNTLDGYVYAIPLFRVRRRNNAGFDPDTNPLGARDFFKFGLKITNAGTISPGQEITCDLYTVSGGVSDTSQLKVGDRLVDNFTTPIATVTQIVSATQIKVTYLMPQSTVTAGIVFSSNASVLCDRPDGLYSNIIDAADITDLRHQVSLTGFNYQALLEKNLDLLLQGKLTTSAGARYSRDYIGLNVAAGLPDDANTLLYAKFDGSINATANGTGVTGTMSTGTAGFVNGVQGQAFAPSTSQYVTYPVSIASGVNTYAIELMFKPNWNWNDGAQHGFLGLVNGSSQVVLAVYKQADNSIKITPVSGGVAQTYASGITPASLASSILAGTWNKMLISVSAGVVSITINGVSVPITYAPANGAISALSSAVTTAFIGIDDFLAGSGVYANAAIDLVRISNIARTEQLLPSSFNAINGDRILDGPNGDFAQWSDDLGGIAGVNGRTNPYGLSRVPNALAARVAYNGAEVRHYLGMRSVTPGATDISSAGTAPSGSLVGEYSAEYWWANSTETADGTRTQFTFNKPGGVPTGAVFTLFANAYSLFVQVNGSYVTPSSVTIDSNTGLVTVVLAAAPAANQPVKLVYSLAQRHAHFIPSTKGFLLHDWTDDAFTNVNGSQTVFQTSKYNVTSLNHVRVAASGATAQTIQNSGYSVSGASLSSRSTLTAAAASGATTITVANGGSLFQQNQNIRISKGDGTWYTTTIAANGVSGNTITIPATTVALSANAVIEGAALVTFTTAPAAGSTVDVVYESVLTPGLGDYLRVFYQHTPYQGVIQGGDTYKVVAETDAIVTTLGTGAVIGSSAYGGASGLAACVTNLPTAVADYTLKGDSFAGVLRPSITKQFMNSKWDDKPAGGYVHKVRRVGITIPVPSLVSILRGTGANAMSSPSVTFLYAEQLSVSVPNMTIWAVLVQNQNGELMLLLITKVQTTNQPLVQIGADSSMGMDVFKLPGRPLIKGYGGVAA